MDWYPGETLWIDAGGVSLEARCWGPAPGDAPTLVLLHEGLGCVDLWRDFPERLATATDWGVFACSRAGYGRSDACALPRPLDYMTREATDMLPHVLDQAGVREAVLLGHSDGASIAALHAGLVRDPRVAGLILFAPHFFVEDCSVTSIAAARLAYRTGGLRDRLARYHVHVDCAFRGWCDAWLDPGFRDWDITGSLPGIEVPCLAVQGEGDEYGTAAQLDRLRECSGGAVEIALLPDCGHAPHKDQPAACLNLIGRFLQQA